MSKYIRSLIAILGLLGLVSIFNNHVSAQAVVQSYQTNSPLQIGFIVQLVPNSNNKVEALNQTNALKMFGVVVDPSSAPITLSTQSGTNQAFVATNGEYEVMVSNQNGPINVGDYITISSIDGVGMKAGSSDQIVLGKALSNFTGNPSTSLGSTKLSGSGKMLTVELGIVNVGISIAHNPLLQAKSNLPNFLTNAGDSIADKTVSNTRIYVSLVILIISAIITGSMLYAGIKSSIVSIGRNPLSKKSIVRSLIQVTLTSLTIFIIGLFAVYLLLRI